MPYIGSAIQNVNTRSAVDHQQLLGSMADTTIQSGYSTFFVNYSPGNVTVSVAGVQISHENYIATNGTDVRILNSAVTINANDAVEITGFNVPTSQVLERTNVNITGGTISNVDFVGANNTQLSVGLPIVDGSGNTVISESSGEVTVSGTVNHESLKVGGVEILSSSGTANLASPNITSPTFSGNPLNLYSGNLSPFVKTQWNMNLQGANPIDWHTYDFQNINVGNYKILFGPNYVAGPWKFGVEFSSVARVWGCIIQPINTNARPQYLKIFHGGQDGASEIQAPARPVTRFSGHGFGTDSPTSSHSALTTDFLVFENSDHAHIATWDPVNSKYWLANFGSSVYNNGNANAGIQNFQWLGTILT